MAVGIGLQFKIVDRAKFVEGPLTDAFCKHGCDGRSALRLVERLSRDGNVKTTVRPSINLSHLRNDIAPVGVLVYQIAGRRC